MIVWEEDIKEGEGWEFQATVKTRKKKDWSMRDWSVQMEDVGVWEKVRSLEKEFPNLSTGGDLLPNPTFPVSGKKIYDTLEWTIVVFLQDPSYGRTVVHPGPFPTPPPHEGDWARHPCCGTVCAVRSAPLRKMPDHRRPGEVLK